MFVSDSAPSVFTAIAFHIVRLLLGVTLRAWAVGWGRFLAGTRDEIFFDVLATTVAGDIDCAHFC